MYVQCWFNVGPPAQTMDQHYTRICSMYRFDLTKNYTFFTNAGHCPSNGIMLGWCRTWSDLISTRMYVQCWFNVGPPAQTMDQHYTRICSMYRFDLTKNYTFFTNAGHCPSNGIMLGWCRTWWTNINPALDQRQVSLNVI